MLNMWESSGVKPDDEEFFADGFLYIISRDKEPYDDENGYHDAEYSIDVKCLNAEYDEPLSLADISDRYPNVCKVIFDDCLRGAVYNYGNHKHEKDGTAEKWEKVGQTLGYA